MKRRGKIITLLSVLAAIWLTPMLESCGTMHSYWGVENDYYENFDGYGGHHYKKHKRPKPPKHKKHKHHHHDD